MSIYLRPEIRDNEILRNSIIEELSLSFGGASSYGSYGPEDFKGMASDLQKPHRKVLAERIFKEFNSTTLLSLGSIKEASFSNQVILFAIRT